MGVAWTRLGTVTVTAGSVTVQGVDTRWQTAASIGDAFHGPDGKQYEVAGIVSDTALQLRTPYQGVTAAGQAYAIMRIVPQGSDAETMALLRQVLNLTDTQLSAFMAWADSQGIVSISDGETNLVGLHGLRKLMADVAAAYPKTGGVVSGLMTVLDRMQVGLAYSGSQTPSAMHVLEDAAGSAGLGVRSHRLGPGPIRAFTTTLVQGSGGNTPYDGNVAIKFHHNDYHNLSGDLSFWVKDEGNVQREAVRVHSGGMVSFAGSIGVAGPVKPGQYALATLPSPSAYEGYAITVSNATGGPALCLSNGAAWINVRTNAPVN